MDKYEYKLKTEQMLELMNDGAYNKAAEIADSIDWKRVRNTTMLSTVSEIYEKNRDYQKSYDVLAIAYSRAEGSRKIVSRLCTLALKTRNVDEAIDYYDDFIELAPKDPNQYILKYQILRAQRAPIEQQIHALEEFKKAEYIEEWAYELAKLYQEAGMTAECLEECDDLILWFSEGKYVYQAMELKMQYKPLTPSQQEKYDRRYEKPTTETEELPDLTQYQKKEEPSDEEVEEELEDKLNESEEQIQETSKKKIGNTMKLDEALKSLLNIKLKDETDEETSEEAEAEVEEEEDLTELESEIEEIESVADLGFAEKVAEEKKKETIVVDPDLEELRPDPELDEEVIEEDAESEEIAEGDVSESVFEETEEDGDQIAGQMNLMDFLEEEYEESETGVGGEQPEFVEEAEEDWIPEADETVSEKEGAMEDKNRGTTPILSPDIQRLIDEIEGNIPPQEEKPVAKVDYYEEDDEPHENMGALADELRMEDESDEFEDYDDLLDEDEDTFVWSKEDAVDAAEAESFGMYEEPYEAEAEDYEEVYEDEAEDFEEVYEDEAEDYEEVYDDELAEDYEEVYDDELAEDYEEVYDDELAEDFEEDYEDDLYEDDLQSVTESFEEEFRPQKHFDEMDDREIPDDDDEIDLLSATTPLSRKETAKLIATGKTAPLPLDEISDALSISDTGFVVHGRYDLKAQSGIGTRAGLTDEQKKLFSYFVPVRGMSEQLVDVLEQDKNCTNRKGSSCTGNLLIIGNKGNGKTVLAVDVVKAIQKQRKIRQGKVAIVTGDSLNKKKISDIFEKLYGGALIIEKAGKMNEKTVARLNKAMESDTGELLIVLEDQRKPLDRLLSSNREFRRKFTSRLEVPVFINDELVTFGQTYAQENGYKIDEMSILALYSRIDSLQREDHAVTVAEVKEIMDEAMAHSQKVSAKKLVKRVFGKNTDDSDRIILTEKDFNI